MPRDRFGREIDYLRLSVTDHCNLRCVYCMPLRGLSFVPSPELLTASEIELVARAATSIGFRKFRLTGGEPTLRPDIVDIVRRVAATPGVEDVAMTTNAILMPRLAKPLREAGLRRINVHVDTFDPDRLKKVMRFGTIAEIERGLDAAEAAGLSPIKINCVVTRDFNDMDVVDIARRGMARGWHVRFIELMPLGGGDTAHIALSQFVPSRETRDRLEAAFGPLTPLPPVTAADESRNFSVLTGVPAEPSPPIKAGETPAPPPGPEPETKPGKVLGFISPVSEPYCGSCNRMRLTADGKFHLCLLNDDELDVKAAIRRGGGVPEVAAILEKAVGLKPTGHRLDEGLSTEQRSMFQIGG